MESGVLYLSTKIWDPYCYIQVSSETAIHPCFLYILCKYAYVFRQAYVFVYRHLHGEKRKEMYQNSEKCIWKRNSQNICFPLEQTGEHWINLVSCQVSALIASRAQDGHLSPLTVPGAGRDCTSPFTKPLMLRSHSRVTAIPSVVIMSWAHLCR